MIARPSAALAKRVSIASTNQWGWLPPDGPPWPKGSALPCSSSVVQGSRLAHKEGGYHIPSGKVTLFPQCFCSNV